MKKENGITLIALVITIIVLLILAGVTIAMLSGENGLLTRATSTSKANDIGTAKDLISVNVSAEISKYYEEKYATNPTTATYATVKAAAEGGIAKAQADAGKPSKITISTSGISYDGTVVETISIDNDSGAITYGTPSASTGD